MKKSKEIRNEKYRKKKIKYKRGGHSAKYWANIELKEWEREQIKLAIKESIRRNKNGIKLPPSIPKEALQSNQPFSFKIKHLYDKNNNLVFWGKYPASMRPQPIKLANGDRSPEDLILNPVNPVYPGGIIPDTPRVHNNAKLLKKLMHTMGVPGRRDIVVSEPEEIQPKQYLSWTDTTSRIFKKMYTLIGSRKQYKKSKGVALFHKLKAKYSPKDFTIAWFREKELRRESPYDGALTIRGWSALVSDPDIKNYGIYIPQPNK